MDLIHKCAAFLRGLWARTAPTLRRAGACCLRVLRRRTVIAAAMVVCMGTLLAVLSVRLQVVTVTDEKGAHAILTLHREPVSFLGGAEIALGDNAPMENAIPLLEIHRSFNAYVTVDGTTSAVRLTSGTVSDALEHLGITLDAADEIEPPLDAALYEDIDITVQRVLYEEFTKTESIPFTTTYKNTIVFKEGVKKTKQAGRAGQRTATYRNRIVDGEVVETILVKEEVTRRPVNAVILVGMKAGTPLSKAPFDIKLDKNGQPVNYKTVYTGLCTAYSGEEGWYGQHTASGMKPRVGVVAVDPKIMPYGTKLYITSADGKYVYGYAIAGDIGSGVENHTLIADLYMDTIMECRYHGKRTMKVYVIG